MGRQAVSPLRLPLLPMNLGLLSNRAPLVNNRFSLPLYAGIRVVSAVGMTPPLDGRSRVRPPTVSCAVFISRNEPKEMAPPTSRQGHGDWTSEAGTNTVSPCFYLELAAPSVGLNGVPDFHMA